MLPMGTIFWTCWDKFSHSLTEEGYRDMHDTTCACICLAITISLSHHAITQDEVLIPDRCLPCQTKT